MNTQEASIVCEIKPAAKPVKLKIKKTESTDSENVVSQQTINESEPVATEQVVKKKINIKKSDAEGKKASDIYKKMEHKQHVYESTPRILPIFFSYLILFL